MRAVILLNAATFAIVHTMATLPTTAAQEERSTASPLAAVLSLDAVVQKRFEHVNRNFGLARIGTAHGFKPESDAEISSVRELEDAHLTVALYLGGRRLLARGPDPLWDTHEHIEGPVIIPRGPFPATTPASDSMVAKARRAFAAFERRESQDEFNVGTWTVVARPVRANGTCLKCHRSSGGDLPYGPQSDLRLGNVLGVVLYAYQDARIRN